MIYTKIRNKNMNIDFKKSYFSYRINLCKSNGIARKSTQVIVNYGHDKDMAIKTKEGLSEWKGKNLLIKCDLFE